MNTEQEIQYLRSLIKGFCKHHETHLNCVDPARFQTVEFVESYINESPAYIKYSVEIRINRKIIIRESYSVVAPDPLEKAEYYALHRLLDTICEFGIQAIQKTIDEQNTK